MYGAKATELIRNITHDHGIIIPEYQYDLVEFIKRENDNLYSENLRTSQEATSAPSDGPKPDIDANSETGVKSDTNANPKTGAVIESGANPAKTEEHLLYDDFDPNKRPVVNDNIDFRDKQIMVMQAKHTAKLWNKRCIIAYHYERLQRLKKLRWEHGSILPEEITKNLSQSELEWFAKYNENLFSYMNALNDGRGLDLTLYLTPPRKMYIQVRCLIDYGQCEIDGKYRTLLKDTFHFLPLLECEKLIQQGVLEQISL